MHITVYHFVILHLELFFQFIRTIKLDKLFRITIENEKDSIDPRRRRSNDDEDIHVCTFMLQTFISANIKRLPHAKLDYRGKEQDDKNVHGITLPKLVIHHELLQSFLVWKVPYQDHDWEVES